MFLFITQETLAQNVNLSWAASFHGAGQEVGKSVAVDFQGNVYTTGYFTGTVDFDPGVNVYQLSSAGQQDMFISKLDGNGHLIWAKRIGGLGNDLSNAISLDMSGNLFITGFFRNTVDFNPDAGTSNLSSYTNNSQDIFVTKLDTAGSFIWAKSFGGSGYYDSIGNMYPAVSIGYSVQADIQGNVYSTGSFVGDIDFDPNSGIMLLSSLSVPNIFVSKLDANGNLVWAKQMGEHTSGDEAYALALDNAGFVYTTGVFSDTADFDPGPSAYSLISGAYNQAFISKLDTSGNFIWAKKIGGTTPNDQASGLSLAVHPNGDILVSGKFKGSADFDPGAGVFNLSSNGNFDFFLSRLDTNGDILWAKSIGGAGGDFCYSAVLDLAGNAYVTGSFKGQVDFDPSTDTAFLTSGYTTTQDAFLMKLNAAGNFLWAIQMGGAGNESGNSLCIHSAASIFLTGYYGGIADFDPGPEIHNLVASGGADAFIMKLNQYTMILPITLIHFSGHEVQAGNLLKWDTENEFNADYIEIQKSKDGRAFSTIGVMECTLYMPSGSNYYFVDPNTHLGMNYYRLKMVDMDNQYQFSDVISIINGEDKPSMLVYPNPSTGEINIMLSKYIRKGVICVTDGAGKIVALKTNFEGQSLRFDLSNLADGVYFVELDEQKSGVHEMSDHLIEPAMIRLRK